MVWARIAVFVLSSAWAQDDAPSPGAAKPGPPTAEAAPRAKPAQFPPDFGCKGGKCSPIFDAGQGQVTPAEAAAVAALNTPSPGTDNSFLSDNPAFRDPETARLMQTLEQRDPGNPYPPAIIGRQDFEAGRFQQAEESLSNAIQRGAENADVYYLRGAARLNLGKPEPAVEDLKKALALKPGHPQAQDLLKLAENRIAHVEMKERPQPAASPMGAVAPHRIPAAKDAFERSTRLTKEAEGRIKVRDYDGALSALKGATEVNPEDAKARFLRAEILLKKKRNDEAAEESTRLLEILPDHAGGLNMRALARNRMGQYALALADADAAVRVKPDSAMAHYNRAYALAGLGRREESLDSLAQAAGLDPAYAPALKRLRELPSDADPLLVFRESEPTREALPSPEGRTRNLPVPLAIAAVLLGSAAFLWRRRVSKPPALEGNYRLERELGRGSMGVVYRAMDLTLKRPVAVKMLRQAARGRPEAVEGLLREARLVAGLKHPNIVAIHTALIQGEDVLLVFEYVSGRTLSEVLKDAGPMPLEEAKSVVKQVADALDYAHGRRIIHRDLKPSNIMVDADGRASVMDFGLAHQARRAVSSLTRTDAWGSPAYMAPEQEEGLASAASDVYSLGACLYEMMTGEPPYPKPVRMPAAPAGIEAVLQKALHEQPESRYRSAGELAAALDALKSG